MKLTQTLRKHQANARSSRSRDINGRRNQLANLKRNTGATADVALIASIIPEIGIKSSSAITRRLRIDESATGESAVIGFTRRSPLPKVFGRNRAIATGNVIDRPAIQASVKVAFTGLIAPKNDIRSQRRVFRMQRLNGNRYTRNVRANQIAIRLRHHEAGDGYLIGISFGVGSHGKRLRRLVVANDGSNSAGLLSIEAFNPKITSPAVYQSYFAGQIVINFLTTIRYRISLAIIHNDPIARNGIAVVIAIILAAKTCGDGEIRPFYSGRAGYRQTISAGADNLRAQRPNCCKKQQEKSVQLFHKYKFLCKKILCPVS